LDKKILAAVIIIVAIPLAFFGLLYYQMSSIQVDVSISETQVISWFANILLGQIPELEIEIKFSNPTFLPVDITNIVTNIYIEDNFALEYSVSHLYIPSGQSITREVSIPLSNVIEIYSMIDQATSEYSGEVEMTVSGSANAHLLFLSTRIPFSIKKYYFLEEGHLRLEEAYWTDSKGEQISTTHTDTKV